jgi:hypothetical protein
MTSRDVTISIRVYMSMSRIDVQLSGYAQLGKPLAVCHRVTITTSAALKNVRERFKVHWKHPIEPTGF